MSARTVVGNRTFERVVQTCVVKRVQTRDMGQRARGVGGTYRVALRSNGGVGFKRLPITPGRRRRNRQVWVGLWGGDLWICIFSLPLGFSHRAHPNRPDCTADRRSRTIQDAHVKVFSRGMDGSHGDHNGIDDVSTG